MTKYIVEYHPERGSIVRQVGDLETALAKASEVVQADSHSRLGVAVTITPIQEIS